MECVGFRGLKLSNETPRLFLTDPRWSPAEAPSQGQDLQLEASRQQKRPHGRGVQGFVPLVTGQNPGDAAVPLRVEEILG